MGRHPFLGPQIAAEGRERAPFLHVPGRVTAGLTEERMEDFRVADANDRRAIGIDAEQTHEPDRFGGRRFARRLVPFDLREVGSDDGNFVPTGEIQERRPWEESGIQPHRAIGHKEIETGRTQKIATHSAASSAARGEHRRKNGRGSYKSWALNDDHPKLFRGQAAGRPTPSFTEKWSREKGSYLGRPHETGPAAWLSKNQTRGIRDERPGTPCLREPRIPRGASVHGEAPRVSRRSGSESRNWPPNG